MEMISFNGTTIQSNYIKYFFFPSLLKHCQTKQNANKTPPTQHTNGPRSEKHEISIV